MRADHGAPTPVTVIGGPAIAPPCSNGARVAPPGLRLDAIASDDRRMLIVIAILAPSGLAIGGPFPVLLAQHGEPARRLASLWAIGGAAAVAGGIVAVLALRVAGATDALVFAAGLYVAAAALAPRAATRAWPTV